MDVFKTTVGDNRAWPISQESYYMHTGGLRPFVAGGDGHFTYYAVCPACDNPIQLVGLNRMVPAPGRPGFPLASDAVSHGESIRPAAVQAGIQPRTVAYV